MKRSNLVNKFNDSDASFCGTTTDDNNNGDDDNDSLRCGDKKGKFKVKGIQGKLTCKRIKKKNKCKIQGKDLQPLSNICPIKCKTFCNN